MADASQLSEMFLELGPTGQRVVVGAHGSGLRSDQQHLISGQKLETGGEEVGVLNARHHLAAGRHVHDAALFGANDQMAVG